MQCCVTNKVKCECLYVSFFTDKIVSVLSKHGAEHVNQVKTEPLYVQKKDTKAEDIMNTIK